MAVKERIGRLRRKLAEKEVEAILVSQPENLYYLSGCAGLEGYLLISQQKTIIVTDFRYIEQVKRLEAGYSIFVISGKISEWLPRLFGGLNLQRLGFESSHLTFASYSQISEILQNACFSIQMVALNGLVESLRAVKEPEEIAEIEKAARITEAVFTHIEKILDTGQSEQALAWEIEKYMRDHGSQTLPFEAIVAAGANAALPHARPSAEVIRRGQPVVIDIGSRYNYYASDLTRTLFVGRPDDPFEMVYQTVLEAQLAAISEIKEGMTGREADAVARNLISRAGFGDAFGHGLGHGIGLFIHENPRLALTSEDILSEGMVFTIEPGIYLSGKGGVRIEDDVVMENGRLRVISSVKK